MVRSRTTRLFPAARYCVPPMLLSARLGKAVDQTPFSQDLIMLTATFVFGSADQL